MNLVLSIFPGIDLFGRAFEEEGYMVVRGPDLLWGGDITKFHSPPGVFDGVIGGPPCQAHSVMRRMSKTSVGNLIPEFLRVVKEAKPRWVVMENVRGVLRDRLMPSEWACVRLRDWDCGGLTMRVRYFWVLPAELILVPSKRPGLPAYSVLASSWKNHEWGNAKQKEGKKFRGHSKLTIERAAELMGYPELVAALKPSGPRYAITLLGNGVPKAMGKYIAKAIKACDFLSV